MNDDDSCLRQRVLAGLECDPGVDAARIGAVAKDGVDTPTGQVSTHAEKVAADLRQAITRHIREYSTAPSPFLWTKLAGIHPRRTQPSASASSTRQCMIWRKG